MKKVPGTEIRKHNGCYIWPKNAYGFYSSIIPNYGFVSADTLEGMKKMIRMAKAEASNAG